MKRLKIFAFVAGGMLVLLALLVALALTPGVQTWAVRRAVAGQPGVNIAVDRVAAGFSSADITGLKITQDGAILSLPSITAKYSAWDFLVNKKIAADDVSVRDMVIDLRDAPAATAGKTPVRQPGAPTPAAQPAGRDRVSAPASPAKNASASPAFSGLLQQLQLPFDVRVDRLALAGRVLLPQDQTATFDLQGKDIAAGKRGTVTLKADFTDPRQGAPLRALRADGGLAVALTADRRIDRVEIDVAGSAEGPNLPGERLKIEGAAARSGNSGGEDYTLALGIARASGTDPLLKTAAGYDPATHAIDGTWTLTLRNPSVATLLAGLGLPDVAANGAGKFRFNPAGQEIAASGELQATASHLEKISPELGAIGTVQLHTRFDGGMAGTIARLERFQLEATAADGKKLAQIDSSQRIAFNTVDRRVTLADPKAELARVALQALPVAWAQPFIKTLTIDQGTLSVVLAVEAEADGSHVRTRAVEPLTLHSLTLRQEKELLLDQVTLTALPRIDYSAEKIVAELTDLTVSMPAGDALAGRFTAEVSNLATKARIVFGVQVQAKIVSLLQPHLPIETGPLAAAVEASGRFEAGSLQLAKATTTVTRENGARLVGFELLQATTLDLAKTTFAVAQPSTPVARLQLGELPLGWAQAFVPKSQFAGTLASGTFEVTAQSLEEVTLNTTDPLVARGVTVALDGKPMVQALDLSASLTATKQGTTVRYDVRTLELTQGEVALAKLAAKGEARLGAKPVLSAKGSLDADAAALMKQPVLAPFATLSHGRVTTVFEVGYGEAIDAKAAIAAKGLTARANNQALGDLDFTVSATLKADGSGSGTLPLTLTNGGRKSDIALTGSFARAGTGYSFDGKVTSTQLVADDLQLLAGLAPATEPTAPASAPASATPRAPATPARATRDTEPFWKGVSGRAEVDLKKVLYGKDYTITAIRGVAAVTPGKLALETLEGRFKNNPFKLDTAITFVPQQAQPYAITGSTSVSNFDVGEILLAANPGEKPALESKLTVAAKLNGKGITLPDLLQNIYGQFDVAGTKGVLRALGRKGNTVSTVSSIVGLLGAVKGSDTTMAVGELGRELNEMAFDTFTMKIERGADLNLRLTTIEFLSPSMRLNGTGSITHQAGVPIQNQPLELQLKLAGKAHLAQLLNRIGALNGTPDDKQYYPMSTPFVLTGSAAQVNSGDLWRILGGAAARAAAGAFLR